MKHVTVIVLLIGIVLLATMSREVGAGGLRGNGRDDRPFRMTSQEAVTGEYPTDDCPFAQVFIEGTGHATHMGAVMVYRTHCFSPFQDPPIYNGYWEATAANGDRIWGSYSGSLVPTAFDGGGNPIRGIITSPYTIEGGTGRFDGASGSGTSTGDYDLVADEGDFTTNGHISY